MAYPNGLGTILRLMGYEPDVDFEVADDGQGPYIAVWNVYLPQGSPIPVGSPCIEGSPAGSPNCKPVPPELAPTPTEQEVEDFYAAYIADPERLVEKKSAAKRTVDRRAEYIRRGYITFGDGQAMTYLRKEDEAEKYKTAGYPTIGSPVDYPWIQAEMDATGLSGQQAADLILAQRDAWLTVGTAIEKERRLGKVNIDAATDEAGVNTARDNATAALEAL